ncbi:coproporphyrinogen III oxidase [Agrilactobacillus composti DSM 18527 = JCM 14202]|uniref:Heme chaperone HemW n=1 Tax=Agrilactobacillus composti DSM 18527 = JCM 14202 TaxID=1423734 RepID=X0PHE9_9LACO|nr:radical SAM family heme chaperone HemW [Agrilactobacillus composti]KRM36851.1 coproporphyrinogen III oxidase [Agrilactobacillus composti DSM 18527 = JCM 14202]GAF41423.1 putative coproporphyrinogen III oxidase [Agrilactobacillus composti DSM 18527 = JCM 14202]
MAAAYIHIPFCDFICYYCDFNKVFIEDQPVDDYIHMLLREIAMTMAENPQEKIDTLYIGGGTPSSLSPKQLDTLLKGIREILPWSGGEFTVECNPNNIVTPERLTVMRQYGVNRLSIGVQSFNDTVLRQIGRKHTAQQAFDAIDMARRTGFSNISIDLIFRLPGQSEADFKQTLAQAIALDLPHYATYSLILEKKTIFYNMQRQGRLHLPSEDAEADMYELALNTFTDHGLPQYEISNFAKPGFESKHNLMYWHNEHYFGFGAGAYGYIGRDRYHNNGPIQQYLAPLHAHKLPVFEHHLVPFSEQVEEEMFLGLRTNQGVSKANFQAKYGYSIRDIYGDTLDKLIQHKLLEDSAGYLRLTHDGRFFGNNVFAEFLIDDET